MLSQHTRSVDTGVESKMMVACDIMCMLSNKSVISLFHLAPFYNFLQQFSSYFSHYATQNIFESILFYCHQCVTVWHSMFCLTETKIILHYKMYSPKCLQIYRTPCIHHMHKVMVIKHLYEIIRITFFNCLKCVAERTRYTFVFMHCGTMASNERMNERFYFN